MTSFGYAATPNGAGRGSTLELARSGAIWVPGNLVGEEPSISPGDVIVLFHREAAASPTAELLGAGRVAPPRPRDWGGRRWLSSVPASDPLYRLAIRAGYKGPPNYMTMALLDGFTEDALEIQRLLGAGAPLLEPGENVFGLPATGFVFELRVEGLAGVEGDEAALLQRITEHPMILGGKPTIRKMRIAVEHVLGWLATNASPAEILKEFPELELDDIRAALIYARHVVQVRRAGAAKETSPTA